MTGGRLIPAAVEADWRARGLVPSSDARESEEARLRRIEALAQAVVEEDEQLERDWGGPTSPAIEALREALKPVTDPCLP